MTIENVAARELSTYLAALSVVLLFAAAAAVFPGLQDPWGERPWFQAAYLVGVFLLGGLIALFLALQALAGSSRAVAWLSGGYLFTSLNAAAQFLTFPEILEPHLAAHATASPQLAPWLWVSWHAGFPCFVLAAMMAKSRAPAQPRMPLQPSLSHLGPVAIGTALGIAVPWLLIRDPQALPVLIEGLDYSRLSQSPLALALVLLNGLALAAVVWVTRLRELLYVWLAVALVAFALDVCLSLAGMARYSSGWYMGRFLGVASAGALMVALMVEHFRMHISAEIRAAFHEQEALHDPLTGLFNRRHLTGKLEEELRRARRYGYPVSLLLLDVDRFKQINDHHGHPEGDRCLWALAEALRERVSRSGDISARYGGEEFAVLLPETGLAAALEVAEEIRSRVEGLHARGEAPRFFTVSVGVATAEPQEHTSAEALVNAADRCLYRAKEEGRNRVVGDEPPCRAPARPAPALPSG